MDILKNLSEIDWELQNTASANQRWKPYLIILQLTHENLSAFFFHTSNFPDPRLIVRDQVMMIYVSTENKIVFKTICKYKKISRQCINIQFFKYLYHSDQMLYLVF